MEIPLKEWTPSACRLLVNLAIILLLLNTEHKGGKGIRNVDPKVVGRSKI